MGSVLFFRSKHYLFLKRKFDLKVYLIRHGETDWNSVRKLQGQTDIRLNDYGIELARLTAEGLKDVEFDYVYSSPLIRAVETAEIIMGDRELEIHTDDRIKEINFGECEGIIIPRRKDGPINPIWQFEFDTEHYVPAKGGETFSQMYERTSDFFDNEILPLEGHYNNVMIVGHGCMNRTILNRILDTPLKDFWDIRLDHCSVSIIEITNGKASVIEKSMKFYKRVKPPADAVLDAYTKSIYG